RPPFGRPGGSHRVLPLHRREDSAAPPGRARRLRHEGPMNGRDFLPAARRLAAGIDEADWRSAASRAYYAAFHAARDLLAAWHFRTPRADRAHNYLYVRLNNAGEPMVERVASLLHELRTQRNFADYDVLSPFAAQEALRCVT